MQVLPQGKQEMIPYLHQAALPSPSPLKKKKKKHFLNIAEVPGRKPRKAPKTLVCFFSCFHDFSVHIR